MSTKEAIKVCQATTDERIEMGHAVIMRWVINRHEMPDDIRLRVERIISRREEWLKIFLDPGGINSINERLYNCIDGRLLCDGIYWALSDRW